MHHLISLIAGSLSVTAFAPFKFSFVAFFALAWLFYSIVQSATKKQAFYHAFLFGLGLFGFGVSWIYISLHSFGNMIPALAAFMVLLLVLLFSVISGFVGFIHHAYFRGNRIISYALTLPSLWVLSEWVREWIFTGFPWMSFGYSQTDNFLASQATLSGVLGVSLITAIIAGLLVILVKKTPDDKKPDDKKTGQKWLASAALLVLLVSHYAIDKIEWSSPTGVSKTIQVVQADIAIEDKWDYNKLPAIISDYFRLSIDGQRSDENNSGKPVDITVWPEAAVPYALHNSKAIIDRANQEGLNILTGIVEVDEATNNYYNVIAYLPEVNLSNPTTYRKRHLVPFGEYIPFQKLLAPVLSSLEIPMSDLTANRDSSPIHNINGVNVGLSICYEDAFSTEISDAIKGNSEQQAHVLINVSEDAWFGDSLAPHQRVQMAQMRALENARYFVRVSNNGLSGFINQKGEIEAITPQFVKTSLIREVPMLSGKTPFSRLGNTAVLSALIAMIVLALMLGRVCAMRSYAKKP